MTGTSEARFAGLVAVRIAWITAIVVCALAILIELFSGTGGGDSSRQLPGFAFSDGGDSSPQLPEFASFDPAAPLVGAAAQQDRSDRTKKGASRTRHSGSGVPPRLGSHPEDTGDRAPVNTRRPKPPQAPEDDPAGAPQAPSVTEPELPQAPVGEPVEAPQAPVGDPVEAPQAPVGDPIGTPEAPESNRPKPPKPPKP